MRRFLHFHTLFLVLIGLAASAFMAVYAIADADTHTHRIFAVAIALGSLIGAWRHYERWQEERAALSQESTA
jgi:hypothetical protein